MSSHADGGEAKMPRLVSNAVEDAEVFVVQVSDGPSFGQILALCTRWHLQLELCCCSWNRSWVQHRLNVKAVMNVKWSAVSRVWTGWEDAAESERCLLIDHLMPFISRTADRPSGVHELWMCLKCFFTVLLLKLFLWQMKSMHFYWGQPVQKLFGNTVSTEPENFHINTIFLSQPWSSVSTLAKSFIDRLLTFDPEDRMTAEEALKHPWLVSMAACSSNKNLHRSISRNLQRRASRASSRCSGSAPSSRLGMRPRSRPGSAPRLGFGNKSQCSLKVASWYFDVLDSVLWCASTVFFQIEQMFEGVKT